MTVLSLFLTLPSTLFPYTTLFRSALRVPADVRIGLAIGSFEIRVRHERRPAVAGPDDVDQVEEPIARPIRDRKSTRLNSSHVGTAYAVFCLKKKRERSPSR